jgi:hypothetical protein
MDIGLNLNRAAVMEMVIRHAIRQTQQRLDDFEVLAIFGQTLDQPVTPEMTAVVQEALSEVLNGSATLPAVAGCCSQPRQRVVVDVNECEIILNDAEGREIVRWIIDEWREEPEIVPAIVGATLYGLREGADALRRSIGLPITPVPLELAP